MVVKDGDAERTDFGSLKAGEPKTLSGPFEWVAVKSKYFVTALLAFDSTAGQISGATARRRPPRASIRRRPTSGSPFRCSAAGTFPTRSTPARWSTTRLGRIGHDFDDVNPYGWPGFRTVIRSGRRAGALAPGVDARPLGLAYGLVLILFGVLVRVLLWPLNQKAMRSRWRCRRSSRS